MERYAIWGRGIARSEMIAEGEQSGLAFAVARRKETARRDAGSEREEWARGAKLHEDEWVVEVEADESDVDAETRHDGAVIGYASITAMVETLASDAIAACAEELEIPANDIEQYLCEVRPLDAGTAWDRRHDEIATAMADAIGADADNVGASAIVELGLDSVELVSDALRAAVIEYLAP